MLEISEISMRNMQNLSVRDGMEKIADTLLKCFPERMTSREQAYSYTERAYGNMKKFPIEDAELPYWTFLSVIIGNEHFYEAPKIHEYLSLEGREKTRLLFMSVNAHVKNTSYV